MNSELNNVEDNIMDEVSESIFEQLYDVLYQYIKLRYDKVDGDDQKGLSKNTLVCSRNFYHRYVDIFARKFYTTACFINDKKLRTNEIFIMLKMLGVNADLWLECKDDPTLTTFLNTYESDFFQRLQLYLRIKEIRVAHVAEKSGYSATYVNRILLNNLSIPGTTNEKIGKKLHAPYDIRLNAFLVFFHKAFSDQLSIKFVYQAEDQTEWEKRQPVGDLDPLGTVTRYKNN